MINERNFVPVGVSTCRSQVYKPRSIRLGMQTLLARCARVTNGYKVMRESLNLKLRYGIASEGNWRTKRAHIIRASVDALFRDGPDEISRERLQRGRLTRQGTTS